MKLRHCIAAVALASAASPALAGPPYLTDDPEPTDRGHWEIYNFAAGEGRRSAFEGDVGLDLNYGAVDGVQLTATLPLSLSRASDEGWRGGSGDVELAVKYRIADEKRHGFTAAIFPRVILPTAARSPGEKARLLLPIWAGKDLGNGFGTFGGGGFTMNPGPGNRDFWQAAVAVTKDVSKKVSVGMEITRQGPDTVGGTAQTRAGAGSIVKLSDRYALLMSAGPTWADHKTSYHLYAALGLFF